MKKIYALWEDVDPQEIIEVPTGILIDDEVRALHLGAEKIIKVDRVRISAFGIRTYDLRIFSFAKHKRDA